jgi:hypothetical protein
MCLNAMNQAPDIVSANKTGLIRAALPVSTFLQAMLFWAALPSRFF